MGGVLNQVFGNFGDVLNYRKSKGFAQKGHLNRLYM